MAFKLFGGLVILCYKTSERLHSFSEIFASQFCRRRIVMVRFDDLLRFFEIIGPFQSQKYAIQFFR